MSWLCLINPFRRDPRVLIRAGLAFSFFYAGVASFIDPLSWVGFIPSWVDVFNVGKEMILYAHALLDIILGVWLISGFRQKLAGYFACAFLFAIVAAAGTQNLLVTFRDISLALVALGYATYEE